MIRAITAFTDELDDGRLAAEQIKSQIGEKNLMANTIGIAACHCEFVLSGVFAAVCEALPFEVVGNISSIQSVPAGTGSLLFALTVLTSDDAEFVSALTPSLMADPEKAIAESYMKASGQKKPALILAFAPFILQNCGDDYVDALAKVSGGAPCFGTLAVDETLEFANCFVLAGGGHHRDKMAMVLIYGDISPKFYVGNISEDRILEKSAVVTKSAGPVLMEANERPIVDYLSDLGLVKASEAQYAMATLPFLLDYNDGTPKVSKILVKLTPEKYVICAGAMPEGSTLYMAMPDAGDVMLTAGAAVGEILEDAGGAGVLFAYSCVSRSMNLGFGQFREMEMLRENLGGRLPYMAASSGGEICPTRISEQGAVNRFHNNAFVACLF